MYKKTLNGLVLVLSTTLIVGCSTDSTSTAEHYRPSATNSNLVASPTAVAYSPSSVVIYDEDKPLTQPAEEITTITVDVYNEYGIKRQQAQVNEMLKEQACSVGGNAVVLIDNPDKKHCYAEVIHVKPIATELVNSAAPSTSTSAINPGLAMKPENLS